MAAASVSIGTVPKTLLLVVPIATLASGQADHPKPLPTPVPISGVIVDTSGRPASGVEIYGNLKAGHGKAGWQIKTSDREGAFKIRVIAPVIVFRKSGFQSQRLRSVNSPKKIVVTMMPASRNLPVCAQSSECIGVPSSAFCFPRVPGIRVGGLSGGDSVTRDFFPICNPQSVLRHDCCGYVSSEGLPLWMDVWGSVEYKETVYSVAGVEILDVRGRSSSGRIWRFLGRAGEYAAYDGYHGLKTEEAALLDKVLDGVCIRRRR